MNYLKLLSIQLPSGPDRKLPQISRMRDLLTRGIGIHHGGLLPIVKEVGYGSYYNDPSL